MKNKIYSKLKICVFLLACTLVFGLGGSKAFAAANENSISTGQWTTMASMKDSRRDFSSEVINGKIYVMGGSSDNNSLSTVEQYDPATNVWTSMASMKYAREGFESQVINGKIYVMGGMKGNSCLSTVEVYDPATNIWKTLASMRYARYCFTSQVINGNLYVMGGTLSNGTPLSTVEQFDPLTNKWTTIASMKYVRGCLESQVVNGKIYVMGGMNSNSYLSTVEQYDPSTNKWTTMASMNDSRRNFESQTIDGKIYVMGGYGDHDALSTVEQYDPATNIWTTMASMKDSRDGCKSEVINGKIYVMGGENNDRITLPTIEEYNPKTNTWTTMSDMKDGRYYLSSEVINGKIYVMGGSNLSSVERFDPPDASTITLNKTTASINVGNTDTLTANAAVKWTSSDPTIATVDDNGVIKGIKAGTVTITATAQDGSNLSSSCTVTVTEPTTISLNKSLDSIEVGKSDTLTAEVNKDNIGVTWSSSDNSVVTVDANGKLTGIKAGTAVITATTTDGKTASCTVTVTEPIEPTTISLNKSLDSIEVGKNDTLTAVVNKDNIGITWTSSDTSVVTVDANGKLTGIKAGTAVITATTVDGKTASCTITVTKPTEPTTISLNKSSDLIEVGKNDTLTAEVNKDNIGITWASSDNSVVTVDANGKLTGIKAGTAVITATTADGKAASCTITVTEPIQPTTISLNKSSDSIEVGKNDTLTAVVNKDNIGITWTSSDTSVVTVDANGKLTGIKAGTAVITATTADGKTASCTVTVKTEETNKSKLTLYMNDTTVREFYLTQDELDNFMTWYTLKSEGEVTVQPYYVFNVPSKVSSSTKKSYVSFFKIENFEVE